MVKIKRCAAVVKGGRRFSFAAMVVVGNGHGRVGWGYGKANEVPPSVEKAVKDGSRSMIEVPLDEGTIPHQVEGPLRRGPRGLVPASPGTGVIAGAAVRAVCEAAGIHDILTKSFGSNNPVNLVKATIEALKQFAHAQEDRAAAGSVAVMNLTDVNRGITSTRSASASAAARARARQDQRPRPQGPGPLAGWSRAPIFEGGSLAVDPPHPQAGLQQRLCQDRRGRQRRRSRTTCFAAGDEVTLESLRAKDLAKGAYDELKVLGNGELTKKLKVSAHRFSARRWKRSRRPAAKPIVLPGKKPPLPARSRKQRRPASRPRRGTTVSPRDYAAT